MYITKIKENEIDVPKIEKKDIIKRGLYTLVYKGKVIKVGCFGEGVKSNNKSRFSSYRSIGKSFTPGNGSYKTMKVLNENLKIGERVKVNFYQPPEIVTGKHPTLITLPL